MSEVKLHFDVVTKTPTLTGEDAKTSQAILTMLIGSNMNKAKAIVQQYGFLSIDKTGFIVRASSFKGLLRVASEYIVELKSIELGLGHAVCSFLDVEGSIGFPSCVLPIDLENNEQRKKVEVFKKAKWINIQDDKIVYNNYPCIPCAIFGAPGLKSLVRISLNGDAVAPVETTQYKLYFFNELGRSKHQPEKKLNPLIFEAIKPGTIISLEISFASNLAKLRGLRAKTCDPIQLGVATIWLAIQLINSGFFRLGRFKSRGLGRIEINPREDTLKIISEILGAEPSYATITKKAFTILENELKERLK